MNAERGTKEKRRTGPEIFDAVRFRGENLAVLHSSLLAPTAVSSSPCVFVIL